MRLQEIIMTDNRSFIIGLVVLLFLAFLSCSNMGKRCIRIDPQLSVSYKGKEYRIHQRSEYQCDSLLSIYLEDSLISCDNGIYEGFFHADIDFTVKDGIVSDIYVTCAYMPECMKQHIDSAIKHLKIRSLTTELIHAKVHVKIDTYNSISQIRKIFYANHGITEAH